MTAGPLRWTGLGKLLSFYRYFAFNAPKTTTAAGIVLLLAVGVVHGYPFVAGIAVPAYLVVYLVLGIVASVLASVAMALPRARPADAGWALGSLVSLATIGMYVASRTAGLPDLPGLVGRWAYPLGTFTLAVAALFVALHFTVLTGMNVAYPRRRRWSD